MSEPLITTDIKEAKLFRRGKVRDVYDLGDKLLVISTDRISCFDVVLPTPIPHKGEVLTQLSLFWFELTKNVINNHFITANVDEYPESLRKYKAMLQGRSMLVKKTKALPVECVVRGYLAGSGWKDYQKMGSVSGIKLPAGLKESDKLPEPIFTPTTKEEVGHDMTIDQATLEARIGKDLATQLKELTIKIYKTANDYAVKHGVIIADTKFEFGILDGKVILIDEILTPDSSRFWPMDQYEPGHGQPSFDKQFVRDYLETLDWDKTPPGPVLPAEIVKKTTEKYQQVIKLLAK
jgi:phosphoribosylaminoimidazole-succinocarboxamide synthase